MFFFLCVHCNRISRDMSQKDAWASSNEQHICKLYAMRQFGIAKEWYDLADYIFLSATSLPPHKSATSNSAAEVQCLQYSFNCTIDFFTTRETGKHKVLECLNIYLSLLDTIAIYYLMKDSYQNKSKPEICTRKIYPFPLHLLYYKG